MVWCSSIILEYPKYSNIRYLIKWDPLYLPLKRGYPLPLKTLESSPSKDDFCQVGLKLAQWFWRRFKMTPFHFYIFVIISPLKRTWPFIWTYLNSLHPRIICTKFDSVWPTGSGVDFSKFSVHFQSFAIISPWRGAIPFLWINLNPLHPKMILPSLVKIGPMVLEKRIFKWPYPIFTFLWLSPLWRGPGPLFEQSWIPFTQG
jgi:hypothetical protein